MRLSAERSCVPMAKIPASCRPGVKLGPGSAQQLVTGGLAAEDLRAPEARRSRSSCLNCSVGGLAAQAAAGGEAITRGVPRGGGPPMTEGGRDDREPGAAGGG